MCVVKFATNGLGIELGALTFTELHGDVEVHANTGSTKGVPFGFETTAGVDDVFSAILQNVKG